MTEKENKIRICLQERIDIANNREHIVNGFLLLLSKESELSRFIEEIQKEDFDDEALYRCTLSDDNNNPVISFMVHVDGDYIEITVYIDKYYAYSGVKNYRKKRDLNAALLKAFKKALDNFIKNPTIDK